MQNVENITWKLPLPREMMGLFQRMPNILLSLFYIWMDGGLVYSSYCIFTCYIYLYIYINYFLSRQEMGRSPRLQKIEKDGNTDKLRSYGVKRQRQNQARHSFCLCCWISSQRFRHTHHSSPGSWRFWMPKTRDWRRTQWTF